MVCEKILSRYSSERPYLFYKRGGSIHILGLLRHFLWVRLRILWVGLIIICNWIISQRNSVWHITMSMRWRVSFSYSWDKFLNWVFAALLLGLRCEWKTSWCGFYDRINCILWGRNALLGMWRGCDQVQIVCVLYWNLNITAEFVMSVPGVSLISASIDKFQCEKRRDYD